MEQNNKLYVGNLPYSTTAQDLENMFSAYGTVVETVIISHRDTGRSKGFGFVTMSTAEEAEAAIAGLHDTELEGRKIVVNIARPKTE